MTLEARSFRDHRFDHLVFNFDPRRHLAAEPPLLPLGWLGRLCRLVHATRLDVGSALQAFQAGNLFALFANDLFQGGDFAEQFNQLEPQALHGLARKGQVAAAHP
jgi:hypothetical protein